MEKLSQAELDSLLSGPEAVTLLDLDLRGLTFPEDVPDLRMERCCAEDLDLNGRTFLGAFVAEDCNFFGACFTCALFGRAAFLRCNLRASDWSCVEAEALTFDGCDLTDATTPEGTVLDADANQDPETVNNTPAHAGAPDTPPPGTLPDTLPSEVNGNQP